MAYTGPWALSERQERLYTMRCRIYRPRRVNTNVGTMTATQEMIYDNVPWYRVKRPALSDPTLFGRAEHDIFGTHDKAHLPELIGQSIGDAYYLVDTTPGANQNVVYVTRGEAVVIPQQGERDAGHVEIDMAVAKDPPPDVLGV